MTIPVVRLIMPEKFLVTIASAREGGIHELLIGGNSMNYKFACCVINHNHTDLRITGSIVPPHAAE